MPAANAGVVVHAAPLTIYGNTVVVDHGWGLMTLYAHLSSLAVKEGDPVQKGQELGRTGTTGLAVGDHLHYEVLIARHLGDAARVVGRPLDPRPYRQAAPRGQSARPRRRPRPRFGRRSRARAQTARPLGPSAAGGAGHSLAQYSIRRDRPAPPAALGPRNQPRRR